MERQYNLNYSTLGLNKASLHLVDLLKDADDKTVRKVLRSISYYRWEIKGLSDIKDYFFRLKMINERKRHYINYIDSQSFSDEIKSYTRNVLIKLYRDSIKSKKKK